MHALEGKATWLDPKKSKKPSKFNLFYIQSSKTDYVEQSTMI